MVEVLRNSGPPIAPELAELLRNSNPATRSGAAAALAELGGDALPALIPALTDPDFDVRRRAIFVLGDLGAAGKDAVPALAKLLNDPDARRTEHEFGARRTNQVGLSHMVTLFDLAQ